MKVFLDSNVLISAALWPRGATAECFRSVVNEHSLVVSDYVLDEVRRVTQKKFPARGGVVEEFLDAVVEFSVVAVTPDSPAADEEAVRDDKDRPVLRGARAARCDVLVTGDRDLLEAGVGDPMIIPPAEYLRRYQEG
ncbi:MAG: putative toxin-antitoxin system toxin component, PIN family [Propioniciclava sp.]|uniref:putative toxin-antitoxin system toxin component, PIN family n=1 Tax=Propioniciclava sp. TaxID=2038686 RepID=UPI0039E3109E